MIGAIAGDIAGSRFEWHNIKTKDFSLFTPEDRPTDDSVMTLAIARALLSGGNPASAAVRWMRELGRRYPEAGYGGRFRQWLFAAEPRPYRSYGNGAAMRVSPCAYAAEDLDSALELARAVTEVTHNHPDAVKAAETLTGVIFLALHGRKKGALREYMERHYHPLGFTLDDIRADYGFDVTCQGSVPQAMEAFLESTDFEDAIRNAVSIGGDSDTIAAIAGSVAGAYYGVPEELRRAVLGYLDPYQTEILLDFEARYPAPGQA